MDRTYENFEQNLKEYLLSKLPDIPKHEIMEISAFVTQHVLILVTDEPKARDKEWLHQIKNPVKVVCEE